MSNNLEIVFCDYIKNEGAIGVIITSCPSVEAPQRRRGRITSVHQAN